MTFLDHSVEVGFLASMMASELGLDPALAKRAGLLHDIGKAVDGEFEGSHAHIGAEFIKRHNETPIIVNAVAAHHDEVKAEHDTVVGLGGWGVPTLVFDGTQALFGPVLIDPPTGEAAVRLWHAVTAWLELPHLYELQRPKRPADLEAIADTFRPYFEGRDWISVQNDTP